MMIPLFQVRMNPTAKFLVNDVLGSGYVGQGKVVDQFEEQLELRLNRKCLTTNSCTSALDLALHLCGVGPDNEVISTAMTCFASNAPIINRHAYIRWADVDPITGLIDPDSVEKLITRKTKAIMAVDWAGRSCDYDRLKSFGIPVIEDAAHCWDTRYKGNPISTHGGDYVCYSFQAIKFLTSCDGGLLVTPDDKFEEARRLRWFGLDRTKSESFRCTQNIQSAGFKYQMNDFTAAVGISNINLAYLSAKMHRDNAKSYCQQLAGLKTFTIPEYNPDCSYWLYSILVEKGIKEEFIAYMKDRGVECSPVHFRNDLYDCTAQFKEGDLPGLDEFSRKQIAIPVGWWLSSADSDYIVNCLKEW